MESPQLHALEMNDPGAPPRTPKLLIYLCLAWPLPDWFETPRPPDSPVIPECTPPPRLSFVFLGDLGTAYLEGIASPFTMPDLKTCSPYVIAPFRPMHALCPTSPLPWHVNCRPTL